MKKKAYMAPTVEAIEIQTVQLLTGSNAITATGLEDAILFGGEDTDGTIDPSASLMPDLDGLFD